MPAVKQPSQVLELKGSYKRHPERKPPAEPKPKGPLGVPPKYFTALQRRHWRELDSMLPPGVAFDSDRWAVEALVLLMSELRSDPAGFSASKFGRLETFLARFGLTPSDRTRIVAIQPEEDSNPWAKRQRAS